MSGPAKAVVAFVVGRPLIAIAIAAAVVGVMLLHTRHQKTPVTHRSQHVGLTDAQQMQLGSQEFAKTLRANRTRIVSSGPQYAEVQQVARRIESIASRDKPDFIWRVALIKKNEANAYCLPGGKIVVYTGILPFTENDAGLATVLGHEVAHATAEHVAERIERNKLTEVAATVIAGGVAFTPAQFVRITALLGVGASLPFSRSQESEAEHIGLVYMARAGYDPIRRSRSGSACDARRRGTRRRSSSATTRATRIASLACGAGCRRPSASTGRAPERDAATARERTTAPLTTWPRRARTGLSRRRSWVRVPSLPFSKVASSHQKPLEQDRNGVSWPA